MARYRSDTIRISDAKIMTVVNNIELHVGEVYITSGDRSEVPPGGSQSSHHLDKRAVDFAFWRISYEIGWQKLREKRDDIFPSDCKFEAIYHGSHTKTTAKHFHIGRYPAGSGVIFKTEGLTREAKGNYQVVP